MPSNNTSLGFFYTYILQSMKDHQQYTGYSSDLRKRIEEHTQGKVFATKSRLPFQLIYYEACLNEADAKQREHYLKTTAGRRFLAKRLKNFHVDAVWHRVK